MKISNVKLAKIIENKGYEFQKVLDSLDAIRTPEEEKKEISEEEVSNIIDNFILSFNCEAE